MMNTNPNHRYQDPGQLLADLISLATQMGLRSVPADGIVWRRIPVRRVRDLSGTIFLSGAVLAICATALVMHFTPKEPQPGPAWLQSVEPATNVIAANQDPDLDTASPVPLPSEASVAVAANGNSAVELPTSPDYLTNSTTTPKQSPLIVSVPVSPMISLLPVSNGQSTTATPTTPIIDTSESFSRYRIEPPGGEPYYEDSLAAAIGKAASGDEILLQFNGVQTVPPLPRLGYPGAENITLRAAPGFRPVLEFQGESRNTTPGRLFHLANNLNLKIVGVDLRVFVRNEVIVDQWVLFECTGANRIDLQDCTIEVQNANRRSMAIIRLADSKVESSGTDELNIRLQNVAVRGAADMLLVAGQPSGRVRAEQCSFVLDGALINSLGADSTVAQGRLQLELQHTTTITARPTIQMMDSEAIDGSMPLRRLPELYVDSHSCVFASLSDGGTLIQTYGNAYLEELEQLLSWNGASNLYHQYGTYWKLESGGGFDQESRTMTFQDWVSNWNRASGNSETDAFEFDSAVWETPALLIGRSRIDLVTLDTPSLALNRSFFLSTSARYRLDRDGSVPGVDINRLRAFPSRKVVDVITIEPPATDAD